MPNSPSVTVVTATIGHQGLSKCIESVRNQTYAIVDHLIVVDGPEWRDSVNQALEEARSPRAKVLQLPFSTGKKGWKGHRIYGAAPFLALSDYVCWLDDDNWFDPDHIASLVEVAGQADAPWAFSLRKIVDPSGNFVALDQCESLGNLHPTFISQSDYLVDTNCYFLRHNVAVQFSAIWNREARPLSGPPPDRLLCQTLMKNLPKAPSTRRYTVNYRVGSPIQKVGIDFFLKGNEAMRRRYPKGLPWEA